MSKPKISCSSYPNAKGQIKGRTMWPYPLIEVEHFNYNDELEASLVNREGDVPNKASDRGLEGTTRIKLSDPSVRIIDHYPVAHVEFSDLKPTVVSKVKQQYQLHFSLYREGKLVEAVVGSEWLVIPSRANKGQTFYVNRSVLEAREGYFKNRKQEEPVPHHAILSYTILGQRYEIKITNSYVVKRKDLQSFEDVCEDRLTINPEHARIFYDRGDWYLEDLNSTNGTYIVCDTGIWKALHNGNVINIGATQLLVGVPEGTKEELRVAPQAVNGSSTTVAVVQSSIILPALTLTQIEQTKNFAERAGKVWPFKQTSIPREGIAIGRYEGNAIALPEDNSISRNNHATLIQDDHQNFFIRNNNERSYILVRISQKGAVCTARRLAQSELLKFSYSSGIYFQFHKCDEDAFLETSRNVASSTSNNQIQNQLQAQLQVHTNYPPSSPGMVSPGAPPASPMIPPQSPATSTPPSPQQATQQSPQIQQFVAPQIPMHVQQAQAHAQAQAQAQAQVVQQQAQAQARAHAQAHAQAQAQQAQQHQASPDMNGQARAQSQAQAQQQAQQQQQEQAQQRFLAAIQDNPEVVKEDPIQHLPTQQQPGLQQQAAGGGPNFDPLLFLDNTLQRPGSSPVNPSPLQQLQQEFDDDEANELDMESMTIKKRKR